MKQAHLVYRPVMDYEESMEPYFICESKEEADTAAKRMCDFAARLAKRMPEYTHEAEADDSDCAKFTAIEEARRALFTKARWPFGVDLQSDVSGFYEIRFDPSCVQVMPLPIIKP